MFSKTPRRKLFDKEKPEDGESGAAPAQNAAGSEDKI